MKKILFFLLLGAVLSPNSFANWDSIVNGRIAYNTTTCTLTIERNIGGHHTDIYSYRVRGPVTVEIPTQVVNVAGGGRVVSISATTYTTFAVQACADTCRLGTSIPGETISAFSVTDIRGGAPYTLNITGLDRTIRVASKGSIPVCLQCQEGQYWCPSANTCLNQGEVCDDHRCNNDTVCDINEGCGCRDCDEKRDHCAVGMVCEYDSVNANNSSCVIDGCDEGEYWCPSRGICLQTGQRCIDHQCNNNNVCDMHEGCGCADCNNEQDHCAAGLICKYNSESPNESYCTPPPSCPTGQYWCSATAACISEFLPCDGSCLAPRILRGNLCVIDGPCLPGENCCTVGTRFCPGQSACVPEGQPCDPICI